MKDSNTITVLKKEFRRARIVGTVVVFAIPLAILAGLIAFGSRFSLDVELSIAYENRLLGVMLVAFSLMTCLIGRVLFNRLRDHIRALLDIGRYREGRLFSCYLLTFGLYFLPCVWGVGYYMLTGGLLNAGVLMMLSSLCYIFFTPPLSEFTH